jgi:hypothetical protein
MVMVAVYTARKFTSLGPHIIYDGRDNEFTDWLDRDCIDSEWPELKF